MNRSTRRVAAALTASAALLLTACGGSDDSKDNDKIAGADAGSEKSASPSASADGIDRPEIKLPSDVKLTFTPERTGDPVKNAVLRDNADMIRALNMAIVEGDPQLSALEFYTEGEGAVAARDWAKSFKDAGWTVTGTVRYFNRNVKVKSKDSAAIGYCADESKGFTRDVKTDEIKRTKVTKDSYVAYSAQLRKNKQGVWELMKMASTRGATGCQP
ncbi:hypothetical protein DEJ48_20510 [Streptomyces venezuelae]|uniref:Lipoprotein n=1 Tax=Streptomyces venezuelae TaxID=54571 RepID=A0A5P2BZ35_STRVZ|nr:hypothetical protein [Streptomyces venezuelae]QES35497.1 hypothetical protein DEJ48_20510 [Streptomyces venezuelae]